MTTMLAAAVLVELFTSEGCASCPPADAVLARLHREQPVPGVQLVVLSEHVDYWNDLGWKDPFSDAQFSDRQGSIRLERSAGGVRISVSGLSEHRHNDVVLAVVEDGLVSKVERGENAGRTLTHAAVVRSLRQVGSVPAGESQWSIEVPVSLEHSWKQPRLIAFVQDVASRRVLASGALQEQRDGAPAERDKRAADDEAHGAKDAHAP